MLYGNSLFIFQTKDWKINTCIKYLYIYHEDYSIVFLLLESNIVSYRILFLLL